MIKHLNWTDFSLNLLVKLNPNSKTKLRSYFYEHPLCNQKKLSLRHAMSINFGVKMKLRIDKHSLVTDAIGGYYKLPNSTSLHE